MWECVALINWHSVRHAIATVHYNASGTTRSIEREHCLDRDIHGWSIEGFKHDLRHALPVGLWVQRCLCQEHWVFLRGHAQLVVECVMPNLFHVIPVRHNAM